MAGRRYTFVFYVAVGIAALATFGVYRVLENTKASSRIATRPLVVAAKNLPEGSPIDRTALSVREWPIATVPAGAFASTDSLIGRVTRVAVFEGEPIVPGRLAPSGTGPGIEVKITPGKRAMALRINDIAGVSGLIQPNSRVDVLVQIRNEAKDGRLVSKLFMENMRVLSVGTAVERDAEGKPIEAASVALEVTPAEAERLAIAASQGSIQLVLRGYGDPDTVKTTGANTGDVLSQLGSAPERVAERPAPRRVAQPRPQPAAPPVVVAAPPKPDSLTVTVFRGGDVQRQKFEKPTQKATP
ncbi:MAG: Flp pilus assembly protein CpaB [Gemmatimonadetes bacterium]|nr:MAG: Flp pilus assembly protein CpaB [Gemmatimonadota bacterium]